MFKHSLTTLVVLLGIGAFTLTSPVRASTVETDSVSTTSQTAFESFILNNDLVNTGQSTLASASESVAGGAGSIAQTHEGSQTFSPWTTDEYVNNTDVLTYQLNLNTGTGGSAFGYDITSVTYIGGYNGIDSYSWQDWDLQIATLTNPTFTAYKSVLYDPAGADATMVVLTGSAGKIETQVTGIQIVLHINSGQTFSVLHEIDVVGTASPTPEPASLGLLSVGGLLLLKRRNRRTA